MKSKSILVLAIAILFVVTPSASAYSIVAWGYNDHGECNVPTGNDFVDIAAGNYHNVALKSDGSLAAWGDNSAGQLNVPAGNDFVTIAAGYDHCLALKSDGSLVAWGGYSYVPAGNNFVAIGAGGTYGLALKSDGSLEGWGSNTYGQCDDVPVGNDFIDIAVGIQHAFAFKTDGSWVAWGNNESWQCDLSSDIEFTAIAAGWYNSLGLASDGSLEVCGLNTYGQFDDVPDGNDFAHIAIGHDHCLTIKLDGSLVAWGRNEFGQSNVPTGNYYVDIAAGGYHNIALTPEPSTLVLFGLGITFLRRRKH